VAAIRAGILVSPIDIEIFIGVGTIVVSIIGSAFISGMRWGSTNNRLDNLEREVRAAATKEQLAGVKEDLAEIKGMFRMVPKDGGGS